MFLAALFLFLTWLLLALSTHCIDLRALPLSPLLFLLFGGHHPEYQSQLLLLPLKSAFPDLISFDLCFHYLLDIFVLLFSTFHAFQVSSAGIHIIVPAFLLP